MQPEQYALMHQEEEHHWWYRGNRAVVRQVLRQWLGDRGRRRLDAGCGTGKNLEALREFGDPVGIDYDLAAVAFSHGRGFDKLARASITALPFANQSFDLVTCFEVLNSKSIPDWQGVIREFHRVLRPGGVLLLREPAFMMLYGSHDVVVHTARRFRRRQLRSAVEAAGFAVERCSYQNLVTFLPALLIRTCQRWRGLDQRQNVADFHKGASPLAGLFARWLAFEGWLLRFVRLPVGSSVLCVATKRATSTSKAVDVEASRPRSQ